LYVFNEGLATNAKRCIDGVQPHRREVNVVPRRYPKNSLVFILVEIMLKCFERSECKHVFFSFPSAVLVPVLTPVSGHVPGPDASYDSQPV